MRRGREVSRDSPLACAARLATALLAVASAAAAAGAGAAAPHAAPPTPLPRLRVRAVDASLAPRSTRLAVVADALGREVTLRGVNVQINPYGAPPFVVPSAAGAYANGACPPNRALYPNPPVCGVDAGRGRYAANTSDGGLNDVAQLRALGYNAIRLVVSWEALEPAPGAYDAAARARIGQVLDWAEEQGVYVIIDMHQDIYSSSVTPPRGVVGLPPLLTPSSGQDGAPGWATLTGGWPSLSLLSIAQLNPAVSSAFQALYDNTVLPGLPVGGAPGAGLSDHFVGAIAFALAPFVNRTALAGVELLNEPLGGAVLTFAAAGAQLYALYRRAVQALTGVRDGLPECARGATDVRVVGVACAAPDLGVRFAGLVLAEPLAVRNLLDFSLGTPSTPWTTYAHAVHAPHVYTRVFTLDRSAPLLARVVFPLAAWPPDFDTAYASAWREGNALRAPVVVTEFGCSALLDDALVRPTLDAQDRSGTGGFLWTFKANCAGGWPYGAARCARDAWALYAPAAGPPGAPLPPNGPLIASRVRLHSRAHARGVAGEALAYGYDARDASFFLVANASGALGVGLDTLVYVPAHAAGRVAVVGAGAALRRVETAPDGSRTAVVRVEAAGTYAVLLSGDGGGGDGGGGGGAPGSRARDALLAAGLRLPRPPCDATAAECEKD